MISREGQSAMEWLMTHSWAILVVMTVGLAMFHLGVFDTTATPSIKGFSGGGPKPLAGQVQYYRDGIMMLTLVNPYDRTVRLEWVDVAPLADKTDRLKTYIGEDLGAGDIGVYYVNASNVHPGDTAMILPIQQAEAAMSVSCAVWISWSIKVGSRLSEHVTAGEIFNAPYVDEDSPGVSGPSGVEEGYCLDVCTMAGLTIGECYLGATECTDASGWSYPFPSREEDPCHPDYCCCFL